MEIARHPILIQQQYNFLKISMKFFLYLIIFDFKKPKYEGTLKPFQSFNANDDASRLYKAMKGFGTGIFF